MRPIDADALTEKYGDWYVEEGPEEGFIGTLGQLLSGQSEINCSDIPNNSDTISRQQAIDELHGKDPSQIWDTADIEVWLNTLPSIQPEQQWIPVSERLPEDEYVLISKKPTKISGSKWCVAIAIRTADPRSRKIQWRDSGFGIIPDDKVLAWMPLPEPYQGR